jgi:beta-glucosidase
LRRGPLYITENGYSILDESKLSLPKVLDDEERIEYYRGYINEVVASMIEDGIDIRGYFAWSLLDNLEGM